MLVFIVRKIFIKEYQAKTLTLTVLLIRIDFFFFAAYCCLHNARIFLILNCVNLQDSAHKFNVCHPEVFNTYINIQCCISQTQQNFIMFIIVLGQHVSILIESSSLLNKDLYLRRT